MAEQSISLSEPSYRLLRQLAEQTGQTTAAVLDKALDLYRRQFFFNELNAGYAALRADPAAWAEVEQERRSMDGCLMDGLDPQERWGEDGDLLPPAEGKSNG